MTDLSENGLLIANATSDRSITFSRLDHFEKEGTWFLTAGSKAVTSFEPDPLKPGVSLIKITPTKIIAVLGDLIRVYSFDMDTE
eukprot:CAMPEP_0176363788 /NCGR_PEP_ID=MMETSP0126-20121128/19349_1 /TAXON_ID=141414 ORGANISM="Strombidinopsis acuminatum, Strain SPMC142" /NCGR_SAMPLE_ID=MMETSP0126 /ASSEMBLY_ACC=CAM_ASM_000229 /LENGTH=83 /DNA_ID=CAMNT_0017720197 /DNA_START=1512 /DNA_END=1763 /DNA_ORIENTATION=-